MTEVKPRKGWKMSCDVGKATKRLESELSNPSVVSPTSQLILQPFFRFSYVTGSSLTLPSELPIIKIKIITGQLELILQPFRHFTYVTTHFPTLRRFIYVTAHSPTLPLLHLRHSSFSSPSFASLRSQALHLRQLGAAHAILQHLLIPVYLYAIWQVLLFEYDVQYVTISMCRQNVVNRPTVYEKIRYFGPLMNSDGPWLGYRCGASCSEKAPRHRP